MKGTMKDGRKRSPLAMIAMPILALLWTVPTLGLLITSLRSREAAASTGWWTAPWNGGWTFDNYLQVFTDDSTTSSLINSVVVAVPATVLPIMFAAFAAYASPLIQFPGKDVLFIVIVALMVVPIQVAFSRARHAGPRGLGSTGSSWRWMLHRLRHAAGGVHPAQLHDHPPGSVVEREDRQGLALPDVLCLVAPMSPGVAAFATLQFLWVWNDLLIAKLFLGGGATRRSS